MHQLRYPTGTGPPTFASTRRTHQRTSIERHDDELIRNYRNWRRYRDTVNELSRLSNRELTDLGIARSDIPFVARKSV